MNIFYVIICSNPFILATCIHSSGNVSEIVLIKFSELSLQQTTNYSLLSKQFLFLHNLLDICTATFVGIISFHASPRSILIFFSVFNLQEIN